MVNGVKWIFLGLTCLLTIASQSCNPTSRDRVGKSREWILQNTEHVELAIRDHDTGSYYTFFVNDPEEIELIRKWILEHAWPPIEQNTTGAVAPRGYFTIFEDYSTSSMGFRIYVYGGTARTGNDIHVSTEDWSLLLGSLPDINEFITEEISHANKPAHTTPDPP